MKSQVKISILILALITSFYTLNLANAFADTNRSNLNRKQNFGKAILRQIVTAESKVTRTARKRANSAIKVLKARVKKENDNLHLVTQAQKDSTSTKWNQALAQLGSTSSQLIQNQQAALLLELKDVRHRALSVAAGATISSVTNLRQNYSRDAVYRTASKQLQLMAVQLRSGISSVQNCVSGLSAFADTYRQLRRPDTTWSSEFEKTADPASLISGLNDIDILGSFIGMDASSEIQKSTSLRRLFLRLEPYSYQSSNNPSLRALVAPSEEYKYPNGTLALIRGAITAHGTSWLAYVGSIQENVSLTTGALTEVCNNSIVTHMSRTRSLGNTEEEVDAVFLAYINLLTGEGLLPALLQQLQQSNADREEIATLLTQTASNIQSAPSTGSTRLQSLIDSLTRLRNDQNRLALQAQTELVNITDNINSYASAVIADLKLLSQIRAGYLEYLQSVSVDPGIIESLQQSWSDVELLKAVVLPAYWMSVVNSKGNRSDAKDFIPLKKCIPVLTDEFLIGMPQERIQSFQKCSDGIGKKQSSRHIKTTQEKLRTLLMSKIKSVKLSKFFNSLEKEMYGNTLAEFAKRVQLTQGTEQEDQM